MKPTGPSWAAALWLLTGLAVALAFVYPLTGKAASVPVLLVLVPFALVHGVLRYGAKLLLVFLVVTLVVSNVSENLSIETGFPFGHYYYPEGHKLFNVPITIGPFYFALGYLSWHVGRALLDAANRRSDVVALPVVAAALMALWDLGTDSIASTVHHDWIWEQGGGVFGVPYTNYLGWWLTTYVFFQVFALVLARSQAPHRPESLGAALQPVLLYGALGLTSVPYFLTASGAPVTDAAGVVWSGHDINETMMVVNLFGVVTVAFVALVKVTRNGRA